MKNGLIIDEHGNKYWYKDDLYHRDDGPAIEILNGYKEWYCNGKLHRLDGPARIYSSILMGFDKLNPDKEDKFINYEWYKDGVLHREDGPAEEWRYEDGNLFSWLWYYEGTRITMDISSVEEFQRIIKLKAFL